VKTDKFQGDRIRLLEKLNTANTKRGTEDLDVLMSKRANEGTDIEKLIEEFHEVMKAAFNESFRKHQGTRKTLNNISVPWWTGELTVKRKRTNALRRKFQR
jgi:inorganic pyrophosphatase/exopolyphosphatase